MSNTNQFLAGFNPTNAAAYVHITAIQDEQCYGYPGGLPGCQRRQHYTGGPASRTNVLEFTTGTANGSYNSNNFASTGVSNILSAESDLAR